MATDFSAISSNIRFEILTRVNISMYEAQGTASYPADSSVGVLEVYLSIEELKELANLKRMRKEYSNGKGGFFPRLISEINNRDDNFFASEASDGSLRVVYFPCIPTEKQYKWTALKSLNSHEMEINRLEVEKGDEDTDDYRLYAECTDLRVQDLV
ncbi:hypothetical protein [Vibrio agarivorans]|uniref:hypothetical protein n=1 Tax=Vibrio agarivorans TaxID=153622 RepID=UPI0025B603C4|nr:hypothetical protein [Vibrio agarivorans]MDN3663144.1 hypothetical protein [Vibrio agarivorans]